jgi:hypothetical protein
MMPSGRLQRRCVHYKLRKMALGVVLGLLPVVGWSSLSTNGPAISPAWVPADATPAILFPVSARDQVWQQWGSGEMRFLGFALYRATLWVVGAAMDNSPHALTLLYRRNIAREQLVGASLDEMRRLGGSKATVDRWQTDLERVLPDVKAGERIIGLHLPGQGARFYHQGRLTGEINDADFARHFFAIWLDPRTRSPDVRALLLQRPLVAAGD